MSTFAGVLAAFFGPGAAGIVVGLLLGVCGLTLHIILWVLRRTPHWSYAGLIFGVVTTVLLLIVSGNNSWQPLIVVILFLALSLLSYLIYPIASRVLGAPPRLGEENTIHKD